MKQQRFLILIITVISAALSVMGQAYSNALLNKATSGNASSQYELGLCYENGNGVEPNLVEAVKWYKKASEKNHVEAVFRLGCILFDGYYDYDAQLGYKNCKDGLNYLIQAKKSGHKSAGEVIDRVCSMTPESWGAMNYNHEVLFYKETPATDIALLIDNEANLLKTASTNPASRFYLGIIEEWKENYKEALDHFIKARAILYPNGEMITVEEKDPINGEEMDYAIEAYINDRLGYYYENGLGTETDYTKALKYWTESDTRDAFYAPGSSAYQHYTHIALCYKKMGQPTKYVKCLEEHQYQTSHWGVGGDCMLSLWLAEAYRTGYGTQKDPVKAFNLFNKITDFELWGEPIYEAQPWIYADACYRIYQMYSKGEGVKMDMNEAKIYFEQALRHGSGCALNEYYKQMKASGKL